MKTFLRFTIATVAVAGLAGCATTHEWAAAPEKTTQPVSGNQFRGDVQYIAAVEHIARKRGVQVQWVNPPIRRVDTPNQ